jgi:hypothetical protein
MDTKKIFLRLPRVAVRPQKVRLVSPIKLRGAAEKDFLREYLQRQPKSAGN